MKTLITTAFLTIISQAYASEALLAHGPHNQITIQFCDKIPHKLPITIKHEAYLWNERLQAVHSRLITITRDPKKPPFLLCQMKKDHSQTSSFSLCAEFSDEQEKSFSAQNGDKFFVYYKGCRLCIHKENSLTGSNNIVEEFTYLPLPY